MGVVPYKTFTFGGVSSSTYDVYLTGEGVFNAPERAVEMLTIPGRNGSYALDQGRFENIEVTYKCGIIGSSESDFATKVSNVRNWLCSKTGYVRLSDDYNPSEYRMAVYKSGLEVSHETLTEGEFDITFDCKPQRWLTSGETEVSVANNGTINNQTPYPASPLIEAWGYGKIDFAGYPISIDNTLLGEITLANSQTQTKIRTISDNPIDIVTTYPKSAMNNGDVITVSGIEITIPLVAMNGYGNFTSVSCTSPLSGSFKFNMTYTGLNTKNLTLKLKADADLTMACGTNISSYNTSTFKITYNGGGAVNANRTYTFKYKKTTSGNDEVLEMQLYCDAYYLDNGDNITLKSGTITADSTQSIMGTPTYIDADIGEAYKINNGDVVSLNSSIYLGSDLPILAPGSSTIKYDNTITQFKVIPRWWVV